MNSISPNDKDKYRSRTPDQNESAKKRKTDSSHITVSELVGKLFRPILDVTFALCSS